MDNKIFFRRLNVAYVFFSLFVILIGLTFVTKTQSAPQPENLLPIKEYGNWEHTVIKTKDDYMADYYAELANLEERTMARILEFQEPTNEWYETYEDVNEMFEEVGQPDEVEEVYVADDIDYLYRAVETEVHGGSFEAKVNVANVILNRVNSPLFPNTIKDVVTQSKQFKYNKSSIDETTINACAYAYEFADTTGGALYFKSGTPKDTWNGATRIMTDDVGHSFYGFTEPDPTDEPTTISEETIDEGMPMEGDYEG